MKREYEIRDAADAYYLDVKYKSDLSGTTFASFIAGAEWADTSMLERVSDYIKNHWHDMMVYDYNCYGRATFNLEKTIEKFQNALKG